MTYNVFSGTLNPTHSLTDVHIDEAVNCVDEPRDEGVAMVSAGPYANHFAPRSRQITMPAPHQSIFLHRPDALPDAQPTVSEQ